MLELIRKLMWIMFYCREEQAPKFEKEEWTR